MYSNGWGVPQDHTEASKWYRLAAEQGYVDAQFNLGLMYAAGWGVQQDGAEASRWLGLAAERGVAKAQYRLGAIYANGEGVPQDYIRAHMWWNLAAAQRHENGRTARDTVAQLMTAEQIAEALRLAREWQPKAEQPQA